MSLDNLVTRAVVEEYTECEQFHAEVKMKLEEFAIVYVDCYRISNGSVVVIICIVDVLICVIFTTTVLQFNMFLFLLRC